MEEEEQQDQQRRAIVALLPQSQQKSGGGAEVSEEQKMNHVLTLLSWFKTRNLELMDEIAHLAKELEQTKQQLQTAQALSSDPAIVRKCVDEMSRIASMPRVDEPVPPPPISVGAPIQKCWEFASDLSKMQIPAGEATSMAPASATPPEALPCIYVQ